ncbi:MAG: hypothetical protein JWO15_422 [Sphingomonadales bacterium]|nr:hypothetical protein [Sphingomonadales bacterium]
MFNVIMRHYDWNEPTGSMELGRVLENTDPTLAAKYRDDNLPAFDRLRHLPCLFIPEGVQGEICRIGSLGATRVVNGEVKFEYIIDQDVPPLRNSFIHEHKRWLEMNLHRHDWDFSRNHWAVKDIDLYRFLLRTVNPRRQRPSVFNIAEHEVIETQLVSVMMPFDVAFAPVYMAIQQAGIAYNLLTRRADEIWEAPGIIQDIVSLIDRARIVVCDLTGRNPNVFYEAGIAHTLGREVIIITQSEHDVPFDLRHLRHIRYLNNSEGLAALTQSLSERMRTILDH